MTRLLRLSVLLCVLSGLTAGIAHGQDARLRKKLIATGWDHPDTKRLLDNLAEMEKRPFDGVVLVVIGKTAEGKPCPLVWAHQNQKWQREWFRQAVDELKACKFRRFTDNFVSFGANPGDVDWFDDAGWENIAEHWRIAAWVAKEAALKGILFDPEPYAFPHSQFSYAAQPQRAKHTFAEYYAQARQRGRQIIKAVTQQYPDITLFCYFMNSVNAAATGQGDPRRALESLGYGLYPAFIDGWLDCLPPSVKLVDGCESAYRYNSVLEYLEAGVLIKGACQELVSAENRAKYRAQVQTSFGIYLDAYWNPKGSPWYIDPLGGSRVERLRANVATALRVADEYVWVYGEKYRWWPTPNKSVRPETWPEALPGCEDVLRFARDPADYARSQLERLRLSAAPANLARNGSFSEERITFEGKQLGWREGGCPAGWSAWQHSHSKGTFTWDRQVGAKAKGAARAAGVSDGCFLQHHAVQPNERYVVRAMRKLQGRGDAWMRLRWQRPEGGWFAETQDRIVYADGPAETWAELLGVVQVPEGAGRLVILLGVRGQQSAEDVAWFDDVELYRLP